MMLINNKFIELFTIKKMGVDTYILRGSAP